MKQESSMFTRRHLIVTTLPVFALLSGCAALGGPSNVQRDILAIANGLTSLVTALAPFAPASVLAKVQTILDQIKADAALIASATDPTNSVIIDIENAVNALAAIVSPFFPMSGAIATAIQTALVLINIVLTLTGTINPAPPTPAALKLKASAPALTEEQARAVLEGYAKTGIR